MANGGVGGSFSAATDAQISNPVTDDILVRNSGGRWQNMPVASKAALATKGGQETVSTVAASTSSTTLDLNNGNVFSVTLSANTTLSVSNVANGKACSFSLYLKQDGTGSRTVTWPSGTKWSGGAPTLSTAANAVDICVLESIDGGTTWYASLVGTNFA